VPDDDHWQYLKLRMVASFESFTFSVNLLVEALFIIVQLSVKLCGYLTLIVLRGGAVGRGTALQG
jgi:hypothetical protein